MFEQRKNIFLLPSKIQDEAHKYIGIKSNWTTGHPCDLLLQKMTHVFSVNSSVLRDGIPFLD